LDKPGQTWRVDGTPTQVGNKPTIQPGGPDTFVTAGPAWANVSNAPFRRHKQSNHEGGIAAPLIASWPRASKQAGAISHEPAHITDVAATCLDAAGASIRRSSTGATCCPWPAGACCRSSKADRSKALGHCAGNLGLPRHPRRAVEARLLPRRSLELYNLETDRTELNDLAQEHPERVEAMAKTFNEWRQSPPEDSVR